MLILVLARAVSTQEAIEYIFRSKYPDHWQQ
jgi:hypothetical protein